jgi:hypothetical protein
MGNGVEDAVFVVGGVIGGELDVDVCHVFNLVCCLTIIVVFIVVVI